MYRQVYASWVSCVLTPKNKRINLVLNNHVKSFVPGYDKCDSGWLGKVIAGDENQAVFTEAREKRLKEGAGSQSRNEPHISRGHRSATTSFCTVFFTEMGIGLQNWYLL